MTDRLLTPRELARVLKIGEEAVAKLRRAGRIPCVRIGQRTIRFDLDAVLKALESEAQDVNAFQQ